MLTAKQEPERPPPDLALDEIEPFVRRLFVHPQGHGNVRRLAKRRMLRRVMALAKMVHTVAKSVR